MNDKKLFLKIKTELEKQNVSLKYFTYTFFVTYLRDLMNVKKAIKNGMSNLQAWENAKIYTTKFYNQNPTSYCTFLELYSAKTTE